MFMPLARALGGRKERKRRAALALVEKGLKRVDTSVMKRVSMLGEFVPVGVSSDEWWVLRLGSGEKKHKA